MKKRYVDIRYSNPGGIPGEPKVNTLVYLTPVAGLGVHSANRWNSRNETFTKARHNWVIAQYPTGLRAFDGIYSKEIALDIVMRYMSAKQLNWVGLVGEEIMKSNKKEDIDEMIKLVRQHIAASNKLITNE